MLVVQCHLLVRLLLLILRSVVVTVTTLLRLLQLLLLLLLLLHALVLKHLLLLRLEAVASSVEVSRVLEVLIVSQLAVLVAVDLLLSVEELEVVEDARTRRSFLVDLQHLLACRFILQLSAVLAARDIIALAKRYQRIISCLLHTHCLFPSFLPVLESIESFLLHVLDCNPLNLEVAFELHARREGWLVSQQTNSLACLLARFLLCEATTSRRRSPPRSWTLALQLR